MLPHRTVRLLLSHSIMTALIPLEDGFTDIIGKAQRGRSLTDEALAERAEIDLSTLRALKQGELHDHALLKVAGVLGLEPESLLAIARSLYQPAVVANPEGLACFQTEFQDMMVNAYLVWDPDTREAAFFDTGSDGQPMVDFAATLDLEVRQIFITHIHTDHILDLDRLVEKTRARAFVSELEPLEGAESFAAGSTFSIGKLTVQTRLTSGHAAGGITYFVQGLKQPLALVGDAMFAGSMGGAALAYDEAIANNREQILTLPDATILCCGHGPLTTVGEQKRANPFFAACRTAAAWA